MKILFCGDIVGKSGRDAVIHHLPSIKEKLQPDCIIINGENAAHGFGITAAICKDLYKAGVNVITTGNHAFDNREIMNYMSSDKSIIRPINYPPTTAGSGFTIYTTPRGQKVLVVNVMGRLFMDPLDDPFAAMENLFKTYVLGGLVNAIVVDMHAEATSEKMGMGHFCDGRASLVVGTHTHVPTADCQILPKGTAYMTDAGMCGDYNSVVGMDKTVPLFKFTRRIPPPERMQPATGLGTLCGVFVETDDATGLAKKIKAIRLGARLEETPLDGI
jgi:metallophosphoesterase (TIGR00282 family)